MAKRLIPNLAIFFILFNLNIDAQIINIPGDYSTIQEGIDNAIEGDTVLVAPDIYFENLRFNGVDIILASHFLITGQESFIEQTIIDGDGKNAVIQLENGETNAAKIIGFTLQHGSNDENEDWHLYGGGIVCVNASPTILKNRIVNCTNSYFDYGDFGGIYCRNSNAIIEGNQMDSLSGNFVTKFGAIVAHNSNLTINNNTISKTQGGYCWQCAGISADSSDLNISGNLILEGNFDGGPQSSSVKLFNCNSILSNNTMTGEVALNYENTISLINNIIQSPSQEYAITEMSQSNANISATYNNVKGNWTGIGNMDTDPMFADAGNGNYELLEVSPCIDTGDPTMYDPDGTRSDIGAFYFDQGTTSVFENPQVQIASIYPNPAKNFVQIDLVDIDEAELSIFSMDGRLIKSKLLTETSNFVSLDMKLTGVYYFILKNSGSFLLTQKIIIIKQY